MADVASAALLPLERRVLANLSIPRNHLDISRVIREDEFARAPGYDAAGSDELEKLVNAGFVVSLGALHESPGKLAAKMDSHPKAIELPTVKARIYERRLQVGHRRWRAHGEQFVMTKDGFAKLHDPTPVGDPTPLPTPVVEQYVRQELARTHSGPVDAFAHSDYGVTLGDKLLEEEYAAWVKEVARVHKALTGEAVQLPAAGGAGYADATELLILDPENGKGSAYSETAPWFMAAVTVAITDADTGSTITEANYTGYARKSVAAADMNSAASGSATNANAIIFAACTAGASAVIGFGKCAASTVGRLIKYGTCATVNVSPTQTPLQFSAATFTTSLD